MDGLFINLLNMSITASWLVLAVAVLRLLLKKAPKWINTVLWAFVGLRLVCPFSFESIFSLIPSTDTIPQDIIYSDSPAIHSGIPAINSTINPIISETFAPDVTSSANPLQIITAIASAVWILGIIAMVLYAGISYFRLHKKVSEGVVLKDNIWLCDRIDTPFILGIFKPRIFLPSGISENDTEYVIAHERAHLRRRDHWWKPLGFILLTVYWFNPMMWLAYILLCRDIELACDEKVIKEMGTDIKKSYSEALINCSISRRTVSACPLAFGETSIKDRIKSVLSYKKPTLWVIIIALISCIVVGVCFLTNPVSSNGIAEKIVNENGYTITNQEKIKVTLSIPKSSLPESIYSEEGYAFKNDEVIAYKDDVTTIFLKQVRFSNEGNDNLYFCFDFSYDVPKDGGKLISPLGVGEKSSFVLSNNDKTMRDQNTVYEDAVQVRGQGSNNLIWFYVSTDTLRQAEGTISFDIYLNRITYLKDGATASKLKDSNPELDAAVSQAIFHINSQYDYHDECITEGHIIYGIEENGNKTTVYLTEELTTFGFKNGYFMSQSSHRIPAVFTFEKTADGYKLTDYKYAEDGERYPDSIKKMFPAQYEYRAFNPTEEDYASLWAQCKAYAEDYLDDIGRDAEVRNYSEVERVSLTSVGISVEVSNKLYETTLPYDMDIGTFEEIEDGVRYIYRTAFESEKNLLVLTREVYSTGVITNKVEINTLTGDIISQNEYTYEVPENEYTGNSDGRFTEKYEKLVYLDYAKFADEVRNEYRITAIHFPKSGESEAAILVGEAYGYDIARMLDDASWRQCNPPLSDLSSPGSVELVADENYRLTVYARKKGSVFAYAHIRTDNFERYYRIDYGTYSEFVKLLHTPESIDPGKTEGYTSYSYITDKDSAYISLNHETKGAFFSISSFNNYVVDGTFQDYTDKIVIVANDKEYHYTFRKRGDDLIFSAEESTPVPEYRYSENSEPAVCIPDGAVFESNGFEQYYIDRITADIDDDGTDEYCVLGYGPTSGLFTVTFSVYENGKLEYFNIFNCGLQSISFGWNEDGKAVIRGTEYRFGKDDFNDKEYDILIKDRNIVLKSGIEKMEYWGEQGLDSPYAPK